MTIALPSLTARAAVLAVALAACRESAPPAAAAAAERTLASAARACASDSLYPVAAAPAAGLWVGAAGAPPMRVAAMIGQSATDGSQARITRRVETLELREGAAAIRLATDTASVKLELLPPYAGRTHAGASAPTAPAAVYAVTPLVVIAAYESCAASAGEPRLRYLRRDERGGVATDLMLRRQSAETAGAVP